MSFAVECELKGYEFRGIKSGQTERGTWVSAVLESPDTDSVEVKVPAELQADFYNLGLRKGDVVDVRIVAYATQSYNGLRLVALPELAAASSDSLGF